MSRPGVLYAALHEKAGAEVVAGSESLSETQLRFMARVKAGPATARWLGIVEVMLGASANAPWGLDISKQYFLQPHLRFGWRLIIQSKELESSLARLVEIVRNAQIQGAAPIEYDVPLTGSPNRSPTAGLMGHVPLGPAAVRSS